MIEIRVPTPRIEPWAFCVLRIIAIHYTNWAHRDSGIEKHYLLNNMPSIFQFMVLRKFHKGQTVRFLHYDFAKKIFVEPTCREKNVFIKLSTKKKCLHPNFKEKKMFASKGIFLMVTKFSIEQEKI